MSEEERFYEKNLHAEAIEEITEKMRDIRNVVQLLEISLKSNEDDGHIVRSVGVIDKMLASVVENDMPRLRGELYRRRQEH